MNEKNFLHFTQSTDKNNILTYTYQTQTNELVTEQYEHKDLKICPFCGGAAKLQVMNAYSLPGAQVRCVKCQAQISDLVGRTFASTENKNWLEVLTSVVDHWNTRTN